jgi:hypothetical protein
MGAPKGRRGETCAAVIRDSLKPGELASFSELCSRVRRRGCWKDETIWQHMMSCVVNLPPARRHWKGSEAFLVIHLDGRYELYDPRRHPKVAD